MHVMLLFQRHLSLCYFFPSIFYRMHFKPYIRAYIPSWYNINIYIFFLFFFGQKLPFSVDGSTCLLSHSALFPSRNNWHHDVSRASVSLFYTLMYTSLISVEKGLWTPCTLHAKFSFFFPLFYRVIIYVYGCKPYTIIHALKKWTNHIWK